MKIAILNENMDTDQPFWVHLDNNAELLSCAPIAEDIEQLLHSHKIDAVIGSDSDLSLIKSIIAHFPTINYALLSSHAAEDFHKMTEGYGFFMQLPPDPGKEHAKTFLSRLAAITGSPESKSSEEQLS